MARDGNPTSERLKAFALRVVRLVSTLPQNNIDWVIGKQLLKSGTSIGANYRESQRASSKSHFISILQISLREADETQWWLEILCEAGTVPERLMTSILAEIDEIIRILAAAVKSAKSDADRIQLNGNVLLHLTSSI